MSLTQPFFGFLVLISFVCLLGGLFLWPLPDDNARLQLLTTFMGILAGSFTTVVSYYFGSSTASKTKDDTINMLSGGGGTGTTTTTTSTSSTSNGKKPVPAPAAAPKSGDPATIDVAGTVSGTLKET